MSILAHLPLLKALGWALLNSLWQFGIICLIFITVVHYFKKISPALKHAMALVLLSAGFIWFAGELSIGYLSYSEAVYPEATERNFTGSASYTLIYSGAREFLEKNLFYISVFYLLSVAVFFTRFCRFYVKVQQLKTRGLSKLPAETRLYVQQLAQQLNISRKVQVWVSVYIDTPMVMGFIKPIILIPLACVNQLSVTQLEAILLHELAHIKRNDYFINLFIATAEILFFFNPFARLLIKTIKQEREKSCDDWVLQFRFNPHEYASALLSLEQSRSSAYFLAIGATGSHTRLLLQRIQRIMGTQKGGKEQRILSLGYLMSFSLLTFIALVNPGNMVVKNIEPRFQTNSIVSSQPVSQEQRPFTLIGGGVILKDEKQPHIYSKKPVKSNRKAGDVDGAEQLSILTEPGDLAETSDMPAITLANSVKTAGPVFSITEKELPLLPDAVVNKEFPYVPNSSFSYYFTEDSSLAKIRLSPNQQQSALQSLVQAQKALDKVDWERIGQDQKLDVFTLAKVRQEIQDSLKDLNWRQIYKKSKDSVNNENINNPREFLKAELKIINNYKVIQQQYETIKRELRKQQEIHLNRFDNGVKEIQKEVRNKKVIVYI